MFPCILIARLKGSQKAWERRSSFYVNSFYSRLSLLPMRKSRMSFHSMLYCPFGTDFLMRGSDSLQKLYDLIDFFLLDDLIASCYN